MKIFKEKSVGKTYWFSALLIIILLGAVLGISFIYKEYSNLKEQISAVEQESIDSLKKDLKREISGVIRQIKISWNYESSKGQPLQSVKQEVMRQIEMTRFERGGYLFVSDMKGSLIAHPDHFYLGKEVFSIIDLDEKKSRAEFSNIITNQNGGFLQYGLKKQDSKTTQLRLAYVVTFPEWRWIIGGSISLDEVQKLIQSNKNDLRAYAFKRTFFVLIILLLFGAFASFWFYYLSSKLEKELMILIGLLQHITEARHNPDLSGLTFYETRSLAAFAYHMNGEIMQNTRMLKEEIREKEKAQQELLKLSRAVEQSPAIVVITDTSGNVEYSNPKFTQVTGYTLDEIRGKKPKLGNEGFHPKEFYQNLWTTILAGNEWKGEFHNQKKDGELYWESATISPIRNNAGRITHFLKVADDISERKRLEQNLEYLAHHDPLTGLPNRLLFRDRMTQAISHAARNKTKAAILMMDLDNFKTVNDTLGHDAGDKLLQQAVKRFQRFIREEDTAARFGGDEFAFIINDVKDRHNIIKIFDRIIGAYREPYQLNDETVVVTASIGIALYPDDGMDFDTLLKKADIAMYHAKDRGKNCYDFYKDR